MKTLLVSLVVAVSSVAAEAQRQPRPRVSPLALNSPSGESSGTENAEASLARNVTLKITGKAPDGTPIDFAMTGTGPEFHLDQPGAAAMLINHRHHIVRKGENFQAVVSIGYRVRVESGRHGENTNYEIHNLALKSTVTAQPGKPVVIAKSGESELKLVIEEAGEPHVDVVVDEVVDEVVVEDVDVVEEGADFDVEDVDVEPSDKAEE